MTTGLSSWTPAEIASQLGIKPFQGRQLFRWIHFKRVFDFNEMTDLPQALRPRLIEDYQTLQLSLVRMNVSAQSKTKKALLQLPDGEAVECVLIRDRDRVTLCLSSQVGCALQCAFCATGLAGFQRDLAPGEIVEQALYLLAEEDLAGRTPNIVYMGMGEPFRNYDNVIKSIQLLMDTNGLGIGARRITVSTAGDVKGIERFAREDWQVRLSVSLHAANDALRSRLVPFNRRYNLHRLREALLEYQNITGRQFTVEWTLLDGVNDRPEDAEELILYIKGLDVSVNLIPWNPVPGLAFAPSSKARCETFRNLLSQGKITATLRQEKGRDIDAACGQLRRTHAEEG